MASCPRVVRYYRSSESTREAYLAGKDALSGAGFEVAREYQRVCPRENPPSSCVALGYRGSDEIQLLAYYPGQEIEGLGLARPGMVVIRVTAEGKI
jgi:hypothetical protein